MQKVVQVKDNSLYANIKRWLKNGELIQLKRGLYVTKVYVANLINKQAYLEFIANNLKRPSYLSGEYILQKYGMLTESVFALTSITRKKTRIYNNNFAVFIYSNIKDDLFTGYQIINKDGFKIKQATKAKALFDFLYLKLRRLPAIDKNYLKSFRLNLEEMRKADFNEFQNYCSLQGFPKFANLVNLLRKIAYDN